MASLANHPTVTVKVAFGGTLRKFIAHPAAPASPVDGASLAYRWGDLEANIKAVHGIPEETQLLVSYLDEDGDPVTLSSDRELNDLIELHLTRTSPSRSGARLITLKFDAAAAPTNTHATQQQPQSTTPARLNIARLSLSNTPSGPPPAFSNPTFQPIPQPGLPTAMDMDVHPPPPSETRSVSHPSPLSDSFDPSIPLGRPATTPLTTTEKPASVSSVATTGSGVQSPEDRFFGELADLVAQHKWVFDAEPELMEQVQEFAQQVLSSGTATQVSLDTARKQLESFAEQLSARRQNEQPPQNPSSDPPPPAPAPAPSQLPVPVPGPCASSTLVRTLSACAQSLAESVSSVVGACPPPAPASPAAPAPPSADAHNLPAYAAQWQNQWRDWARLAAASAGAGGRGGWHPHHHAWHHAPRGRGGSGLRGRGGVPMVGMGGPGFGGGRGGMGMGIGGGPWGPPGSWPWGGAATEAEGFEEERKEKDLAAPLSPPSSTMAACMPSREAMPSMPPFPPTPPLPPPPPPPPGATLIPPWYLAAAAARHGYTGPQGYPLVPGSTLADGGHWDNAGVGRRLGDGELDPASLATEGKGLPGAFPASGNVYTNADVGSGSSSACGPSQQQQQQHASGLSLPPASMRRIARMERKLDRRIERERERVERIAERERGRALWAAERDRERERSRRRGVDTLDDDEEGHEMEELGVAVPGSFPGGEETQFCPSPPPGIGSVNVLEAVKALESMGFQARPGGPSLGELIESYGGRVERVVEALLRDAEVDEVMDNVVVME